MTIATKVCAKCGTKIFSDAPRGVCPACLLETGLGLLANDDELDVDPMLRPGRGRAARPAKMLGDFGDYELLKEMAAAVRA